jgi:succinate dehydrogenase/fumarate reductase-like Fe-S protein
MPTTRSRLKKPPNAGSGADMAPDTDALINALQTALPYVQAEAAKAPTEPQRIERRNKAREDARDIADALAAAECLRATVPA